MTWQDPTKRNKNVVHNRLVYLGRSPGSLANNLAMLLGPPSPPDAPHEPITAVTHAHARPPTPITNDPPAPDIRPRPQRGIGPAGGGL